MRNDISSYIIERSESNAQTISENANPMLSLVISRKNTTLEDDSFAEKRKARKAALNALSDCSIAICHPRAKSEDSAIWIAYVENNKLRVRQGENTANLSDNAWTQVDVGDKSASKCAIGFPTTKVGDEYVTSKYPWIFYISGGAIHCMKLSSSAWSDATVVNSGALDLSVRRYNNDGELCLFYLNSNGIYYKRPTGNTWSSAVSVSNVPSGTTQISSFDVSGNGVGLIAYAGGNLYQNIGAYSSGSITWSTWREIGASDGIGLVAMYHDGNMQAIYNHEELCYRVFDPDNNEYGEEQLLYDKSYATMDSSDLNPGTLYMVLLIHGELNSALYVFRYMYMKDISSYTSNVDYTLQVDNGITQVNAQVMNINDSLYNSNATLFAPSSKLRLGVKYGDSEVVPMSLAYIDEVEHHERKDGGDTISISARNVTGVFLRDMTFDDDLEYYGTPSFIVTKIMNYFGVDDFEVDTSADEDGEGNNQYYTIVAEPKKTGLKALEELASMLSDEVSLGKLWKCEERYDGKIIVGYDDFRNEYIPKSFYTFNGENDVFARDVSRCIDGVYSKVRCTGITPGGKEISVTWPVTTWRFWSAGEHKTYHADKIEGITKKALKKYAKALAKQLKRTGKITTYESVLRPQLVIGDVAQVLYSVEEDEDPERVGIITEITHTFSLKEGYKTKFVIDSGGNIQESGGLSYSANTKLKGNNRKTRITDFLGTTQVSQRGGDFQEFSEDEAFVEKIRNLGFRLLDEPANIDAQYDAANNQIKIKYADPNDIITFEPDTCPWAGTVVVRNENGSPRHRWDGLLISDSNTRNEFQQDWLIDDNDIKKGNTYYYGIFPYHIETNDLDNDGNPKKHYRYTKTFYIVAGIDLEPPIITKVTVKGINITIRYEIKPITGSEYDTIVLAMKKDTVPTSVEDADQTFNLGETSTKKTIKNLDEDTKYYFVIFVTDTQGNKANSDPAMGKTKRNEGYDFEYSGSIQEWTVPKTGIYSLETWGAQGGDASDGTLTVRGGYGAYAYGEMLLREGDILYINVGGQNGYGGGGTLEKCLSEYANFGLGIITDFSVITDTIKGYTSPANTRIYGASTTHPSWVASNGDLIYESNYSDDGIYTFVDSEYFKATYGLTSSNKRGLEFYNKVNNSLIDSFNDNDDGVSSQFYFSIILDASNARGYILVIRYKDVPSQASQNGWRVNVISAMYNGIDLIWETFKNQI